jgi:hypothetical protein
MKLFLVSKFGMRRWVFARSAWQAVDVAKKTAFIPTLGHWKVREATEKEHPGFTPDFECRLLRPLPPLRPDALLIRP